MDRDDVIEYSLDTHHNEEQGKHIRKKIWKVTAILSILTTVEVFLGIWASGSIGLKWEVVKYSFIIMTLIKAAYIVLVFMHLGDERKELKWAVIIPYIFFAIYILSILLFEGATKMP